MKNLKKFFGALCAMAVCAMFIVACGTPTVEKVVNDTSKKLPTDAGNGMTITEMTYEDGDACYVYTVTAENFINAVSQGEENMAKIFANAMQADDPLVKAVLNEKAAIHYTFVTEDSDEEFEFTVSAEDLSNLKK